jgi:hypothetical protein
VPGVTTSAEGDAIMKTMGYALTSLDTASQGDTAFYSKALFHCEVVFIIYPTQGNIRKIQLRCNRIALGDLASMIDMPTHIQDTSGYGIRLLFKGNIFLARVRPTWIGNALR